MPVTSRLLSYTLCAALLAGSVVQAEVSLLTAEGKAGFVNAHLGTAFQMGAKGYLVLIYDTEANDTDPAETVGLYASNAIRYLQIYDENQKPLLTSGALPNGALKVTDGGDTGDSFTMEVFSDARFKQDTDNGLRGPMRNDMALIEAFMLFRASTGNIFTGDALPSSIGEDETAWPLNTAQAPAFGLIYCNGCGTGGGFGRAVTFEITEADIETDIPLLTFKPQITDEGEPVFAVSGETYFSTYDDFQVAHKASPDIRSLLLNYVSGSNDDDTNLKLALELNAAGYGTKVKPDGLIASGGVDLFLAGQTRELGAGACVGVHSWSDSAGKEGKDFPKDSSEHHKYLEYFRKIGISEELYWFTLDVAPAKGMYWMTQADVMKYAMTTSAAPVLGTQKICDARTPN